MCMPYLMRMCMSYLFVYIHVQRLLCVSVHVGLHVLVRNLVHDLTSLLLSSITSSTGQASSLLLITVMLNVGEVPISSATGAWCA